MQSARNFGGYCVNGGIIEHSEMQKWPSTCSRANYLKNYMLAGLTLVSSTEGKSYLRHKNVSEELALPWRLFTRGVSVNAHFSCNIILGRSTSKRPTSSIKLYTKDIHLGAIWGGKPIVVFCKFSPMKTPGILVSRITLAAMQDLDIDKRGWKQDTLKR